jgi:hypothetical protein
MARFFFYCSEIFGGAEDGLADSPELEASSFYFETVIIREAV